MAKPIRRVLKLVPKSQDVESVAVFGYAKRMAEAGDIAGAVLILQRPGGGRAELLRTGCYYADEDKFLAALLRAQITVATYSDD